MRSQTQTLKSSYDVRVPKIWNDIPKEVRSVVKIDQLKNKYDEFISPRSQYVNK